MSDLGKDLRAIRQRAIDSGELKPSDMLNADQIEEYRRMGSTALSDRIRELEQRLAALQGESRKMPDGSYLSYANYKALEQRLAEADAICEIASKIDVILQADVDDEDCSSDEELDDYGLPDSPLTKALRPWRERRTVNSGGKP